ncbi:MAG: radical SAM protein [Candidatus Omnitrophica bacterium]|nr:radical SAM protein [Candidatus Omnitrophota bacterium]
MGCDYFSEINYGEFAKPVIERLKSERIPLMGTLEITRRCNLKCVHCYCNLPRYDEEAQKKEIPTKDIYRLLDQLADKGCLFLLITGGEPLARDDFFEIYEYARKKGFIITLFTNAALIDKKTAGLLEKMPPQQTEITLYGATREVYEKVTGVSGSFDKCLNGIHNLLEKNIPLSLKTMVSSINKHQLTQMKKLAEDLKLKFRFDPLLHPRIDAGKSPRAFRLAADDAAQLDIEDKERLKAWQEFLAKAEDDVQNQRIYSCGAGNCMFFVGPYGKISVCSMILEPAYDIREHDFNKIWDDLFLDIVKQQYSKYYKCRDCRITRYCQQCPGWSILENNDIESEVEYLCQIAEKRKEKLDRMKICV